MVSAIAQGLKLIATPTTKSNFLDAVNSNLYNNSINVGGTSYNTDYLKSDQGKSKLAELIKQADTSGYTTYNGTGTGDNTKLGSTLYNPNGSVASNSQNNYTFGDEGVANKAVQNGNNTLYNALSTTKTDANGVPTTSSAALPQQANALGTQQSTQPIQSSSTDYINQLKQAQISNSIAGLDKQKTGALSNLSTEKALIQPAAYNDRNAANVTMNNSNTTWNEYLASKGLSSSGVSGQGFMNTQNAYQGDVGSINRDATAKEADIAQRTTDVNNNYLSDITAAQSGAEMTALQNQLNQYNSDKTLDYQKSRDAITDSRYTNETAYNRGQVADTTSYNRGQDALTRTDTINQAMGYVNPTANVVISNADRQALAQYSNDYTAYANAHPNTSLGNTARVLANEKIFASDTNLAKYGEGFKTSAQKAQDLQNEAQQLTLKYQPLILQGQIDGTKLQNKYQELVNKGVPKQQAADLAAVYANISQGNAQVAISQQNANTNASSAANSAAVNNAELKLKQDQVKQEKQNVLKGLNPDGTAITNSSAKQTEVNTWNTSAITTLDKLTTPQAQKDWLLKHKAEIVQNTDLANYNQLAASYGW